MMYEDFVPERLAKLRALKGVSARDMSLSLGQANNYINNIENKKSLPAIQNLCLTVSFGLKEHLFFHFVQFHVWLLSSKNLHEKRAST